MKEKDSLFSTLDAAENGVRAAAAAVLRVNEARAAGHYNYTKTIETKHKTKVVCFNGSPYYTYHQETRFDQQRFDNDLANANKQLAEKQQQLAATKIDVQQKMAEAEQLAKKEQQLEAAKIDLQQKIDAAHSIINQHDALQKNNQNLLSSINHQKNNLNAHGNLDHKTASRHPVTVALFFWQLVPFLLL